MTEMPQQEYQSQSQSQTQDQPQYPGAGPTAPAYRQLRRSRSDRMLAGVCGGIAEYLRVDPTLVRVGFAVLAIVTWGVALLAYVVGWALMPEAE
jgi:phage shock protein PspC (stress-responsive transcriptional regulator)